MYQDDEKVVAMLDEVCELLRGISKQQETIVESKYISDCLEIKVFRDGNQWCAIHGDDFTTGLQGWGDTPAQAVSALEFQYHNSCAKEAYALYVDKPKESK